MTLVIKFAPLPPPPPPPSCVLDSVRMCCMFGQGVLVVGRLCNMSGSRPGKAYSLLMSSGLAVLVCTWSIQLVHEPTHAAYHLQDVVNASPLLGC